mmetsp:Transcript_123769/g.309414  ORF Transcript_123769/g.309414 Transcript_123769/m.309414 type:complete len:241 (+) Transcript_123769:1061-1783(+)
MREFHVEGNLVLRFDVLVLEDEHTMLVPSSPDYPQLVLTQATDLNARNHSPECLSADRRDTKLRTRNRRVSARRCADSWCVFVQALHPILPQGTEHISPIILLPRQTELPARLAEDWHDLQDSRLVDCREQMVDAMVVQDLEEVKRRQQGHVDVMVSCRGQAMFTIVILGVFVPEAPAEDRAMKGKASCFNAEATDEVHDAEVQESGHGPRCKHKAHELEHVEHILRPPGLGSSAQATPK